MRIREGAHSGDLEDTARPLQVRAGHFHRARGQAGGPELDAGVAGEASPNEM